MNVEIIHKKVASVQKNIFICTYFVTVSKNKDVKPQNHDTI